MGTMRRGQWLHWFGLYLWIGVVLAGCGGNTGDAGNGTTARLSLRIIRASTSAQSTRLRQAAPTATRQVEPGDPGFITRLRITVSAADIRTPIVETFSLGSGDQEQTTIEVLIPIGNARSIAVEAFNANNLLVFRGETASPVDIQSRANPPVTIGLERGEFILIPASAENLAGRAFMLDNGQDFGIDPALGASTAVFGVFDENATSFLLTTGEAQAGGEVTLGSCTFHIETSTFAPGSGPQVGDSFTSNPCSVDAIDNNLILELASGTPVVSEEPVPNTTAFFLSATNATVAETDAESTNAVFTVRLSVPRDVVVSVDFQTVDDTAIAGVDYQARSGTLTFNPGEVVQTVSIPVLGDRANETDETFRLVFSNPQNVILPFTERRGTIINFVVVPGITVAPDPSLFGNVTIGQEMTLDVIIASTGTDELMVGTLRIVNAAAFTLASGGDNCSGQTIAPGGSCVVTVRFAPTSVGVQVGMLSIPSNAPGVMLTLSGTGVGVPGLSVSANTLTFGSVNAGDRAGRNVTLTNTGTAAVEVRTLRVPAGAFSLRTDTDTCSGQSIAPEGTCTARVLFTPTATTLGAQTGTLTIPSNTTAIVVSLTGTGVGVPGLTPSPSPVVLTTPVGTEATQALTLRNSGSAVLAIGALRVSAGAFSLQNDTCSDQTVAVGHSCTVDLLFAPTAAGEQNGTLTIPSNVAGSPTMVPLQGIGGVGSIAVDPSALNFNLVALTAQSEQPITVSNTGTASLSLGAFSIAGDNAALFTLQEDTCSNASLAPEGTCTVMVRFAPTDADAGVQQATLAIPSNDPNMMDTAVSLQGEGIAFALTTPEMANVIAGNAVALAVLEPPLATTAVSFAYRQVEATDFTLISADTLPDFIVAFDTTAQADGAYELRAIGTLMRGNPAVPVDVISPLVRITINNGNAAEAVIREDTGSKRQQVQADRRNQVVTASGVLVDIPAGALPAEPAEDTLSVRTLLGDDIPDAQPGTPAGLFVDVSLASGIVEFPEENPIFLSVPYADNDNDGIVDGTTIPENMLSLWTFDAALDEWVQIVGAMANVAANVITGTVTHLTPFGVFQVAPAVIPLVVALDANSPASPLALRLPVNHEDVFRVALTTSTEIVTINSLMVNFAESTGASDIIGTFQVRLVDADGNILATRNAVGIPTTAVVLRLTTPLVIPRGSNATLSVQVTIQALTGSAGSSGASLTPQSPTARLAWLLILSPALGLVFFSRRRCGSTKWIIGLTVVALCSSVWLTACSDNDGRQATTTFIMTIPAGAIAAQGAVTGPFTAPDAPLASVEITVQE